jgi:transcriptional regulator with XRE-family HTH domain
LRDYPHDGEFRNRLNRLGLTQTDFARLININVKTVKRWASLTDPFEIPRVV